MKITGQAYYAPEGDGGAGGGAPAGGQPGVGSGEPGGGAPAASDWRTGMSEDLRGYVDNKGWSDAGAVAESYRNLEKLQGVPKEQLLKLPGADATPEDWNPVWERLGRPANAADYNIPVPEGVEDTTFADHMRGVFHKNNVPAKMVEGIVNDWNAFVTEVEQQSDAQYKEQIAAENAQLQKDWGAALEQNTGRAKIAAQALGVDGETIDALENQMGYAKVMKLFYDIGTKMGEGEFVGGGNGGGFGDVMAPAQAQQKLSELQSNSGWVKKFAEGDADARSEYNRLMKLAYPGDIAI